MLFAFPLYHQPADVYFAPAAPLAAANFGEQGSQEVDQRLTDARIGKGGMEKPSAVLSAATTSGPIRSGTYASSKMGEEPEADSIISLRRAIEHFSDLFLRIVHPVQCCNPT